MRLQILSDLHLETETFEAQPAPGAELLVLAGDIDRDWEGLRQFAHWPVPVVFVAGNHEFDGRDVDQAAIDLRAFCDSLGIRMLHRDSAVIADDQGRRIRFCGTVRWSDFDLFGEAGRAKALRAGSYFQRVMGATRHGQPFDAEAVRVLGAGVPRVAGARAAGVAAGALGQDRGDHAFRAEPAQRRSALRAAADDGQLLQRRRRPDPARRPVDPRPSALPPRLPRAARRACTRARGVPGARPGEEGRGRRATTRCRLIEI